ncbi:MAG: GIY-YIG nuclease family protein [Flavobacterium piscis]|nr:GIY-YIG nuclease family protein [Flavobacterium piscis]
MKFRDIFTELENLTKYKVHLATGQKDNDPLIAFLQDKFKEWQESQANRNFERDYIVSLISYDTSEWLFAGIYKSIDSKLVKKRYKYKTELLDLHSDLIGRLIIRYKKKFRQSYPYLENIIDDLDVSQILKEKYSIIDFPGYENTIIDFNYLQTIIKKNDKSWCTALQNVKGVYLITDKTNGKQYVGSAYGEYSFWSRWAQYAESGHGGNIELKSIIEENGKNYAQNFQFSILELHTKITDDNKIIEREQHWKNVLLTKEFGYNKN